jgi:hypothetical protein
MYAAARAAALALVFAIAACTQSLVGESFSYVTSTGGPPHDAVKLPDGDRVYWWRSPTCEMAATIDASATITAAEFTGADCAAMRRRFGLEP